MIFIIFHYSVDWFAVGLISFLSSRQCEWELTLCNDLSEPYFEEEPVFCVLIQEEMKEKAKLEEEKKDEEKEDPKGIPEFWLTVFKNVDLLSDMLQVL